MMQKIQKFGGAMYTPAILFAFSGIVVGLGTLFTTEAIFGSLAVAGNPWYDCWNVLLQGGWTLFNQMPLLFCVALPITLATHQQARACMEALAAYLMFNTSRASGISTEPSWRRSSSCATRLGVGWPTS